MTVPDDGAPARGEPALTSVADLLGEARGLLHRLTPAEAQAEAGAGGLLIDIRSDTQRTGHGVIPGARFIPRNVLEWRCDPSSEWSDPEVAGDMGRRLIVFCHEGYQSSLVAALLQRFGFRAATDMIGGFQAWSAAGLPVAPLNHNRADSANLETAA